MRPCTRRIASDEGNIKATSLDAALVEHAPWCRTAPDALLIHIKPLGTRAGRGGETEEELEVVPEMRQLPAQM